MNKTLRLFTLLLLASFLLPGCKKKETPGPDLDNAEIAFENLSENQEVHGTLSLLAKVQSDLELDRMVFYVDDKPIHEDIEAPYEADWNTTDYDEGSHTVKLVAFIGEVSKEVTVPVIVKNRLITLSLKQRPSHKILYATYAYLTDSKGEIIGDYVSYEDTEEQTINRPEGFTATTFHLNILYVDNASFNLEEGLVYTIQDLKAGDYELDFTFTEKEEVEKTATVKVLNLPDYQQYNLRFDGLHSNGSYSHQSDGYTYYEIELEKDSPDRLLARYDNVDTYNNTEEHKRLLLSEEISAGQEIELDFNDLQQADYIDFFTSEEYMEIDIDGFLKDREGLYNLGNKDWEQGMSSPLKVPYLKEEFDYYRTWIESEDEKAIYQHINYSNNLLEKIDKQNIQLEVTNTSDNQYQLQLEGDYDIYILYYESNTEYELSWMVFSDKAQLNTIPLEIPQELKNDHPEILGNYDLKMQAVQFTDLSGWSGKDDYLQSLFSTQLESVTDIYDLPYWVSYEQKGELKQEVYFIEDESSIARQKMNKRLTKRKNYLKNKVEFSRR